MESTLFAQYGAKLLGLRRKRGYYQCIVDAIHYIIVKLHVAVLRENGCNIRE